MAARRGTGTRAETVHCEYCGEDYAVTYKRCPFCNGRPPAEEGGADLDEPTGRWNVSGGGDSGRRGPSPLRIIGTVVSLALIVAAVCIVISIIKPMIDKGSNTMLNNGDQDSHISATDPTPSPDPDPTPSVEPESADPAVIPNDVQQAAPPASATPNAGSEPTTPATTAAQTGTATSFTLNKTDITINDAYPDPVKLQAVFTPTGSSGSITWSSSDTEIASVDQNGTVSPGSKNGTATITASLAGGSSQTCTVRCSLSGSTSESNASGTSGSSGAALSLNHTDFTFSSSSDTPVPMRVIGTSSTPTWSIGNTSVASISADGVVRPVGSGSTTITCTVDGQTLECIVRCNW